MFAQRLLSAAVLVTLFAAFPAVAQETVLTTEPDPAVDTTAPGFDAAHKKIV